MPDPPRFEYRQHLQVETPEHVLLDYEVAGIGSRTLAAIADWLLLTLLVLVAALGLGLWRGVSTWLFALQLLALYAIVWGYFAGFEGLRRGQTPGKRWMGIRVIRDTGHAVTFSDAVARNLLLPVDLFGLLGVFLIALHPRAKRLGDMVAGTVVIRDRPMAALAVTAEQRGSDIGGPDEVALGAPLLADPEFRLLREFIHRAPQLPPAVRDRLARDQVGRLAARFPERPAANLVFLEALYHDERARRQGRFGARAAPSAPAGSAVVERLVARKAPRWSEFQQLAERVTRDGLDVLAAHELPDFAARYREVAADLARARTYGADALVRGRLERLVAAGHNALYRENRRTWKRLWHFVARECPGAIVASWRYVTLALLAFLLPAAGGYALLRERPELAPELLPDVILERAEAGTARQAAGEGYVQESASERPLIASAIITNNIRVAFLCFAGGIVFGVGALVALAFNGLLLGAVSAHFANAGLLRYLWTFIIGHGVLELFAIWVAGAAGLRLGRALIAPGQLPRRDALVLAGRSAIRMIGAVIVLLAVAGAIEGFVSASDWPFAQRVMVSSTSVVFLALYLLNGAWYGSRPTS